VCEFDNENSAEEVSECEAVKVDVFGCEFEDENSGDEASGCESMGKDEAAKVLEFERIDIEKSSESKKGSLKFKTSESINDDVAR
jgi:hypothetical protein